MSSSSSSSSSSAYLRELLHIESSTWEDKIFGESCPLRSADDAHNLPLSSDYFVNTRGQRIQYRITWPTCDITQMQGVIVFMHGYAAHTNRPIQRFLTQKFISQQYAYVTFDFHSHGYSDGEAHALISSAEDLVNDCLQLLLVLFGASSEAGIAQFHCKHNAMLTTISSDTVGNTSDEAATSSSRSVLTNPLPFHLIGHSMGGGIALLTANILQQSPTQALFSTDYARQYQHIITSVLSKQFSGIMLCCPLIEILNNSKFLPIPSSGKEEAPVSNSPPRPPATTSTPPEAPSNSWQDYLRDNMVDFFAFWYPKNTIPDIFMNDNKMNEQIWAYEKYRLYIENDPLSYHGNIRFLTLKTMLEISNQVQRIIPQIDFPFLVLHDSQDAIVSVNGIMNLLRHCKSTRKAYIEVAGGLHDILANRIEFTTDTMVQWLKELQSESGMMMMSSVDSSVF